jgi:hypothetical protein
MAGRWGSGTEAVPALAVETAVLLWSLRDGSQAGGGSFVPDGTSYKEPREPSDQYYSLGYGLSPSGLDGGSPASEASLAGFGQTGLLAANAFFATGYGATKYFRKKSSSLVSVEYCRRRGESQWLAGRVHVRIRFWKATARRFGNPRYDDVPG